MTKIEIYSKDYDAHENVVNNGMSGKIFLTTDDASYECSTIEDALQDHRFKDLSEIVLYYQQDGVQYFKKLR